MPESLASSHGWQGPWQQGAHQQAAEIPLTCLISQLCYTAGSSTSAPHGLPPSPGSYGDGPSLPAQQQDSGRPLFLLGTLCPNRQGACLQDADRRLEAGACLNFLMVLLGSPSWRALLSPAGLPYRVGGAGAPPRCFSRRKSFSTNPGTAQCFTQGWSIMCAHTRSPCALSTQCLVQHNSKRHMGAEPTCPTEGCSQLWVQAVPAAHVLWEALLWLKRLEKLIQAVTVKPRHQPTEDSHHASPAGHTKGGNSQIQRLNRA